MGIPKPPEKALLFVGALYGKDASYLNAYRSLQRAFGEVAMETPPIKWDFSDYYREEMGEPLFRRFLFFKDFVEPDSLSRIKLTTNDIEAGFSTEGKRSVNLDPGYLTPAKIILASTKDYSHRIYLKDGIYAEVTMIFRRGEFVPHVNTYNDFKDERYKRFFSLARELFFLISRSEVRRQTAPPFAKVT